jgi:hypothetical protein
MSRCKDSGRSKEVPYWRRRDWGIRLLQGFQDVQPRINPNKLWTELPGGWTAGGTTQYSPQGNNAVLYKKVSCCLSNVVHRYTASIADKVFVSAWSGVGSRRLHSMIIENSSRYSGPGAQGNRNLLLRTSYDLFKYTPTSILVQDVLSVITTPNWSRDVLLNKPFTTAGLYKISYLENSTKPAWP